MATATDTTAILAATGRRRRRTTSPGRPRRRQNVALVLGLTLLALIVGGSWLLGHAGRLGHGVHLDSSYVVTGPPTISAELIDQVLANANSPASGKGQALYDDGVKYGIDPVYALAFFFQESNFGTTGVARVTRSLGNIRTTAGYEDYQGYRKYATWEDGFRDWYKLIKQQYVQEWKLKTIRQIIPVYAPSNDNNDVDAYVNGVETVVDTWRTGEIEV